MAYLALQHKLFLSKAVGDQKRREKYDKQHGIVTEEQPTSKREKGYKKPAPKPQDNKPQDNKPTEKKSTADNKKPAKAFIRSNSDKYYTSGRPGEPTAM